MKCKFLAFVLLVLAAMPASAQTPDDNPVINAYRQQGSGGLPDDNFMNNAYERKGYGLPDDNFVRDMMIPSRRDSGIYQRSHQDMLAPRLDPGSPDDQD